MFIPIKVNSDFLSKVELLKYLGVGIKSGALDTLDNSLDLELNHILTKRDVKVSTTFDIRLFLVTMILLGSWEEDQEEKQEGKKESWIKEKTFREKTKKQKRGQSFQKNKKKKEKGLKQQN